jgi:hypothetical protein
MKEFRLDLHVDDIEMLFEKFDVDRTGQHGLQGKNSSTVEGRIAAGLC